MSGAPVFLLAVTIVLAVAAIGVSLFAVWRSQMLAMAARAHAVSGLEQCAAMVAALRVTVEELSAQMRDIECQPPVGGLSAAPKSGLNLSKRSQVLRMHRNGDAPERIAAALEVPQQEVDLLIKVHRIVLSNV